MSRDGHQGPHHAQRNRHGPEARFAKTNGLDGLTQPIFMMDKGCRHRGIGRRDNAEEQEQREVVFDGQEGQGKNVPVV